MNGLLLAIICGGVGGFIAWNYPIAPWVVLAAFVLVVAASFVRPRLWLVALPALIPIVGFASWTGWLVVEEVDLFVLAFAAGAYAALSMRAQREPQHAEAAAIAVEVEHPWHLSIIAVVLVLLFTLSLAWAVVRGVGDTSAFRWSWSDGYYDSLNSIRIGKSFPLALLLAPLLLIAMREAGSRAVDLLAGGFAIGTGLAALTVVWERIAFTGLLNFSSDYRATGMFWEMHVGGAALDGYLALGAPFVIWTVMRASGRDAVAAAGLALLVSYACLATFSRGVYLAIPISIALIFLLLPLPRRASSSSRLRLLIKGALAIVAAVLASFLVFRAGGYRSLLAVLGVLALSLRISTVAGGATVMQWTTAAAIGTALALLDAVVASLLGKGPYVVYTLAFALCAGLTLSQLSTDRRTRWIVAALGSYVWAALAAIDVARHWGGNSARLDAALVVALLVALTFARSRLVALRWPTHLREQGIVVATAAVIAGSVAVMLGGHYMGERFSTAEQDFEGRIQHWRDGLGLLATPADWVAGKGLGQFPKSYFFGVPDAALPGSYRIAQEESNAFLALSGPRGPSSWGEILRVAQRVPLAPGPYTLTFSARAPAIAVLHVEICQQHLLYNGACATISPPVVVRDQTWQSHVVTLDGTNLTSGPWYAPTLAFFAIAVASQNLRVDIDNISLVGPRGRSLIENGDFSRGMTHWLIVSEKIHLPWHIKNLAFNVLFDHGAIGLVLFVLLVGGTLWRLIGGRARAHPMAPFIAASLVGFLVVGAFDSLLDIPRVALAFYLVLLIGLALDQPMRQAVVSPH